MKYLQKKNINLLFYHRFFLFRSLDLSRSALSSRRRQRSLVDRASSLRSSDFLDCVVDADSPSER